MAKYYKKVNTIVENPWTQPVLKSKGTLGGNSFAVQSKSNTSGSYYDWQAFDGNTSTWWISGETGTNADANANYYIYNPVPLHITNIYVNGGSYYYEGRFNKLVVFGSNDNSNYTLIDTIQTTLQSTYNLQIKNNKGYKYYKFNFQNTNNPYPGYISIKEITLTATQLIGGISWQECTKAEYDQLPADQRKIVTDIYNGFVRKKILESETKDVPFVQPILTSNGTLGGDSFAVYCNTTVADYKQNHPAWHAVDGNPNTVCIFGIYNYEHIILYNPVPIKISSVTVTKELSGGAYYRFSASNDNVNWTILQNETNSDPKGTITWYFSNNKTSYKYFKLEGESTHGGHIQIVDIQIEGTIKATVPTKAVNCYYADAITSLKNMSIIKEPVTDYVSVSEGVASATGVQKLTDAQALSIINGQYVWTQIYNNNIGIATYTFRDNIALSSFSFTTGWNGDGLAYPSSLKWEALVNGSWISVYSATASEGGWGGNRANRTINVNSGVFSNTYRFSIGGYNITLGGIPYYDWLQDLKLNVIKKIVIDESKSVFIDSNIQTVGTLAIDNNGIASGFSNANYCQLPAHFAPSSNWEVNMCVQPHSTATLSTSVNWWESHAMILGIPNGYYGWVDPTVYTKQPNIVMLCTTNSIQIMLHYSTYDGGSTAIGTLIKTGLTLSSDKFYDIKINFTGTSYIAQYREYGTNNWITLGTINSSTKIGECQLLIGHSYQGVTGTGSIGVREDYFNGKIDLFNSYIKINNQLWWTNKQISKSGLIVTNHLVRANSEMKEVVVEKAWTQPVLTSNGTLGGDSFAVYASGLTEGAPYRAFDGIVQTNQSSCCTTNGKGYIEFYNPTPLKLVSIQTYDYVTNTSYRCQEGIIYGSNDGTNWNVLTTFTQPTSTGTGNLLPVINVNSNDAYKYFKIKNEKSGTGGTSGAWVVPEIIIIATEQVKQWVPA